MLKRTIKDLSDVAQTIAAHKPQIEQSLNGSARSADNLVKMSASLNAEVPTLLDGIKKSVAALGTAADELARTSKTVRALVNDTRPELQEFTQRTLPEVGLLVTELRQLTGTLSRVARDLEREVQRLQGPVMAALTMRQPDLGNALALVILALGLAYLAGARLLHMGLIAGAALPVVAVLIAMKPYRWRRMVAFMNPWEDPQGDGFQIIQSLIAVGTGGVWGRGLMQGVQKLFYLPEPHTDFIYAVIAEETGLVGAVLVLASFGVLACRGLRTSLRAPVPFGALLSLGLTMMLVLQAFVNISVVLGLAPTKGIPLPLVSAGGSSLLICLLCVGVLLNISQHATETGAA